MGFYNKYVLPKAIHWACGQKPTMMQREKVIPLASGNVLEIGIGSGLNLPIYDGEKVKHLIGIDPSKEIWNENANKTDQLNFGFEFVQAFAEQIPLDGNSIDTVVTTYTMCSIPVLQLAFEEIRRVLKPSGKLIFCEHGKAPDKTVQRWQNWFNPVFNHFGGGCNLNRDIPKAIRENGFKISKLDTMYIPGWKPVSFNYWGTAGLE